MTTPLTDFGLRSDVRKSPVCRTKKAFALDEPKKKCQASPRHSATHKVLGITWELYSSMLHETARHSGMQNLDHLLLHWCSVWAACAIGKHLPRERGEHGALEWLYAAAPFAGLLRLPNSETFPSPTTASHITLDLCSSIKAKATQIYNFNVWKIHVQVWRHVHRTRRSIR